MAELLGSQNDVELFETEDGPVFRFSPSIPGINGPIEVLLSLPERTGVGRDNDLLKKAVGAKKNSKLKVIDLTAGLLRDSFHLLQLNCQVTAIEENPLLAKAIQVLLSRVSSTDVVGSTDGRIIFVHGMAEDYLATLQGINTFPDAIYFDPMFGHPDRKAGSGKETLLLQQLCSESDPVREIALLKLAQTKVRDRVVVKRPIWADPVGDLKPDMVYKGKAVRFDVYKAKRST